MSLVAINDLIGGIAAFLTVIVGVPQAVKTYLTKTVVSVSLPSFILYYLGTLLWILYVTLTPNKWLPLGITDILSCFVLTVTITLIYHYSYQQKLARIHAGTLDSLGRFQSRITSRMFTTAAFLLYAVYLTAFTSAQITGFSLGDGKVLKYIFFVGAFLGVTIVFSAQTVKTIQTRSTEGLSFGICLISFILNTLWEISWWLRMILVEEPYHHPAPVVADPVMRANLVEELWVGMSLQMLGVIVFLIQTIVYLIYHDWRAERKETTVRSLIRARIKRNTQA